MPKVLKFLELNVQWFGLGLAVLWLAWMVWGYVLQAPVKVQVGPTLATPGEVDPLVEAGPAKQLQEKMANESVPNIVVKDFVQEAVAQFSNTGPAAGEELKAIWANGTIASPLNNQPVLPQQNVPNPVVALPALPDPIPLATSQGRSLITPLAPAAVPGQAAVPAGPAVDKNWVSMTFKVSMKELAANWKANNIPSLPGVTTCFLNVELVRQEQLPGGAGWGPDKVIAPLPTVTIQPLPAKDAGLGPQIAFLQWAEKSQADILNPPFYAIVSGDTWYRPGTPPPVNPAAAVPAPAPKPEEKKPTRTPTPRATQPPTRGPTRPPGADAMEGIDRAANRREARAPIDTDRPVLLAQAYRDDRGAPAGAFPGAFMPDVPAANPAAANGGAAGALPNGQFVPANQGDIEILAHDDSAEPGKTYRYKIRYSMKSPVFKVNITKPPALSQQFSITSADSQWTNAVSVPSLMNFFITQVVPGRNIAKVDVFRWQNGAQRRQSVEVVAGDSIGGILGEGDARADYDTGFTVVDVKAVGNKQTVVVVANDGHMEKRDPVGDLANPKYKELKDMSDQAEAAATAKTAGANAGQ